MTAISGPAWMAFYFCEVLNNDNNHHKIELI